MRYCLASKFQGCLVGSILGEALSSNCAPTTKLKIARYEPASWLSFRSCLTEFLLDGGQFSSESLDWQCDRESSVSSDRLCLLLLPLIIFSADNLTLLAKSVLESNSYFDVEVEEIEDALIWGSAIALALKGEFSIEELIERASTVVEVKQNSLIAKLKVVKTVLQQNQTPSYTIEKLSSLGNPSQVAIALSIYFGKFTFHNYDLAVRRAINAKYRLDTTVALTGALAGAYNSLTGIPIEWRIYAKNNVACQKATVAAKKLFDAWCGVYLPSRVVADSSNLEEKYAIDSVASVKTIKPRPGLNIISQTEY